MHLEQHIIYYYSYLNWKITDTACLTTCLFPVVSRLSTTLCWGSGSSDGMSRIQRYKYMQNQYRPFYSVYFGDHTEHWLFTIFIHTSYVTPLSVPASQGVRSATNVWTQPQSLVQRSSPDRPTFQSGLGPSMVRKDMKWWIRSTENSADGAARLVARAVDEDKDAGSIILGVVTFILITT